MKAFPHKGGGIITDTNGMDLRDYFAAKAMLGFIQFIHDMEFNDGEDTPISMANMAYEYADAMMEARK